MQMCFEMYPCNHFSLKIIPQLNYSKGIRSEAQNIFKHNPVVLFI